MGQIVRPMPTVNDLIPEGWVSPNSIRSGAKEMWIVLMGSQVPRQIGLFSSFREAKLEVLQYKK